MAEIVVVGAGLGGLAVAARLAKQGHRVTICERGTRAGGAMHVVTQDGFRWDAGPASTSLPAVLRDLFRKSGRPIERYVDLRLRDPARRHVFEDGAVVDLPTGSRAGQISAVEAGLGGAAGRQWTEFVDGQAAVWDTLRLQVLDDPDGGRRLADRDVSKALRSRLTLARLLRRSFRDARLRTMAAHHVVLAGSAPRDAPAFVAVETYVERSFGVWSIPGGLSALTDALVTRLDERGVDLRTDTDVVEVLTGADRVRGVRTLAGKEIAADIVITDIDPRRLFGDLLTHPATEEAQAFYSTATPAMPLALTHLGLSGDVPALPDEVVLHGDPLLVVRTCDTAPAGRHAWTVLRRGAAHEDVLIALARRGIDVRGQVETRVDRSPVDLVAETGGSSYGLAWSGWRATVRHAALGDPMPGLHCLGASVYPGGSVPYVVWRAAHVAGLIGNA